MTATTKPTTRRPNPAGDFKRIAELIRERGVQVVDVKFCDLPGTWQHFSIPAATLDEDMVREGLGFDGSSIRGFQAINESDMLLMPDLGSAFVD
ncbi:MAG TPA: glutamine synthetase, partial [Gemmatimonadales bacterium]|nr:glutamine synthetase [Gemmatimonadales bacterium]